MVRNRSPVAAPHNSNTTTIMRSIPSEFSDDTGRCSPSAETNQRRLQIIVPDHLQPSPDQICNQCILSDNIASVPGVYGVWRSHRDHRMLLRAGFDLPPSSTPDRTPSGP